MNERKFTVTDKQISQVADMIDMYARPRWGVIIAKGDKIDIENMLREAFDDVRLNK